MYRIVILPDARQDIIKASQWYEDQSQSSGDKFESKTVEYIYRLQSDLV